MHDIHDLVRVQFLGKPSVTRAGEALELPSRRAMAVLGYVAGSPDPVPRAVLASMFWPDSEATTANGNLRQVLSHLRRLDGLLEITRTTVRLAEGAEDRVDVRRFDLQAGRALRRARVAAAGELLEGAWEAWGGEFLAGLAIDLDGDAQSWLEGERTRLRLAAIQVLEALVDTHLADSPTPRTVQLTAELVALDPYREASVGRRMRALWRAGEPAEALRYHESAVARLAELGFDTTDDLDDLATRIRQGGVASAAPPAPVVGTRLPPARTLVGRDADRQRVDTSLRRGRLVTLTGPGGVGKTSLALVVAHAAVADHHRAVQYVDLVDAETDAAERVLADLLADEPTGDTTRAGMLVLDNFEHVLAASPAIAALHERHPDLTILITSRAPLRLAAEQVVVLAPLDVVAPAAPLSPAVELFLTRAAEAGTPLARTEATLEQVTEACRRVDGLPLAIELAAARLRMFGLHGLLEALRDDVGRHLEVLGGGRTDGPERHRTARNAIAWSHDLLDPAGQQVLRRMSVFAGAADLAAVQAVCAGDGLAPDDVVEALAELVSLHLVTPVESPTGRARFRLLRTTHAFASERLREDEGEDTVRGRHADFYAGRARIELADGGGLPWLDRVADLSNHAAACRWFTGRDDHERARQLLADLGPAFRYAGRAAEGVALHTDVSNGRPGDPVLRAECDIWRAGLLAEARSSDTARAVTNVIERSLPRLGSAADPLRRARVLSEAVQILSYIDEADRAIELATTLRAIATTPAELRWELGARWEVAWIAHRRGNDNAANRILRELIPEAIELGNRRVELYAWMLADLAGTDRSGLTANPPGLHDLLDMSVEVDDRRYATWLLVSMGAEAAIDQRLSEAAGHFRRAFRLADELQYDVGFGFCLLGVVGIRAFSGDLGTAARLHAALEPHLPILYRVLPRAYRDAYEGVVDMLSSATQHDAALKAEWHAGAQLSLRAAADEARSHLERLVPTRSPV